MQHAWCHASWFLVLVVFFLVVCETLRCAEDHFTLGDSICVVPRIAFSRALARVSLEVYSSLCIIAFFLSSRITHVEVTIEAPYEFLHDVLYPTKQPFSSGYR